MRAFERYESYESSSVEWIGDIPSHWEMKKIKYVASINPSTNVRLDDNAELEFVPMENVDEKNGLIREYSFRPYEDIKTGYTPFQNDDVIFAKITPCMENGNCAIVQSLSKNIAFGSTEFIVLRSNDQIQKELLYYILRDKNTRKIFEINMTGSAGQKRVPTPFVANFKIPLPPLEEQKQIADFLDIKSKQIDEFIADKQALMALFEEQKSAVINEAVTKGLNKTAQLKPSGIEWLGDIPSHWEVRKFKYSVEQKTIKSSNSAFKIGLENIESKTSRFIATEEDAFNEDGIVFKAGDVLFGKLRPYLVKVYIPEQDGICVSEFLVLSSLPKITNNKFVKYLMLSGDFIDIVNGSTYGSKMPRASWDFIGNLKIPLPPLEEQKQIVEYLEKELSKIDTLIETAKAEITLIEEYKTSLINEVVTGKIKVNS